MRSTKFLFLVFFAAASGCHRSPDPDYLRDYAKAQALIDDYRGDDGVLDEAQGLIDTLLQSKPQWPHAHVEKARLLLNQGHIRGDQFREETLANAETELRTAISLDDAFCDAHVVLAHTLYRMKRYPEAVTELDRSDAAACPTPWRLMNRVEVDFELQRFDEAESVLAKVPAMIENEPPRLRDVIANKVLSDRIWIAYQRGDQAKMLGLLREQVAHAPPNDAWTIGNAAESFTLAGAFDEAVATAHEALHRMSYGAAERTLGIALFGESLWRSSRTSPPQDSDSGNEWAEAERLVSFEEAGNELWGSLANRDLAFRKLLQQKIMEFRQRSREKATKTP